MLPESSYFGVRSSRPQSSGRHRLIVMMQATHLREGDDRAMLRRLQRPSVGTIHSQREICPPAMVVVNVAGQQAPALGLTQHDDATQALPPDAPDYRLHIGMVLGTPRSGQHLVDTLARDTPLKLLVVHSISISEEVLRGRLPGKRLDQLLRRPPGRRTLGHGAGNDRSPRVRNDH